MQWVKIDRNCCYFEANVLARRSPSRINFLADVSDRLLSAAGGGTGLMMTIQLVMMIVVLNVLGALRFDRMS